MTKMRHEIASDNETLKRSLVRGSLDRDKQCVKMTDLLWGSR